MSRKRLYAATAALFTLLGACQSPSPIATKDGPTSHVQFAPTSDLNTNPRSQGLEAAFFSAYQTAVTKEAARLTNATAVSQDDQAAFKEMAAAGFAAVRANCSDYFDNGGESEKWLAVTKDGVALAAGVATGIIALAGGSQASLAALSFSTVTIYGGMDVYTKRFLFGAENITTVRTLILKALDVHAAAVLQDPGPWRFGNALNAVLDNQEICQNSAIVRLVKEAIFRGDVVAAPSAGQSDNAISVSDKIAMQQVGQLLDFENGAVPSDLQLAALYWYSDGVYTPTEASFMKNTFTHFPRGPLQDAPQAGHAKWNLDRKGKAVDDDGALRFYLSGFSAKMRQGFATQIDKWKEEIAKNSKGPAFLKESDGLPPTPSSDVPVPKNYSVSVQ